jgi:hypothetical protein
MTQSERFVPGATARKAAWILVAVGILTAGIGLASTPQRTWPDLLLNGYYTIAIALGGMVFVALHYLSGAAWSATIRRVPEALMAVMPVAAVLMLVLVFGREWLYPATRVSPRAAESARALYLSAPFFFGRMAVFVIVWTVFAHVLRRTSLRQDSDAAPQHREHLVRASAAFVVVFAVSFSLASFDWLMTLTPDWSSTIFAFYSFAGVLVGGIAAVTMCTVLLLERGYLVDAVSDDQLHDLGKLLLASSTFWAYLWFAQYLLIWYGNLPEETTYYMRRTSQPWIALFLLNVAVNWIVPFLVLLPRATKRSATTLKWVAMLILAGRWLDLYLAVMPEMLPRPDLRAADLLMVGGYAATLFLIVTRALASAPLVPLNGHGSARTLHAVTEAPRRA